MENGPHPDRTARGPVSDQDPLCRPAPGPPRARPHGWPATRHLPGSRAFPRPAPGRAAQINPHLTPGVRATAVGSRSQVRGRQRRHEDHGPQRAGGGPVPPRGLDGPGRPYRRGRDLLRLFRHRDGAVHPHPAGPPVAAPSGPRVPGGRSPGSGATGPAGTQPSATGRRTPAATGTAAIAGPGTGSAPSGRAASPGPLPTATWSAPGGVLPSGLAGPSSAASSPPSATPSPVPSAAPSASPAPPGNPGGLCLQLGPLGICLSR